MFDRYSDCKNKKVEAKLVNNTQDLPILFLTALIVNEGWDPLNIFELQGSTQLKIFR